MKSGYKYLILAVLFMTFMRVSFTDPLCTLKNLLYTLLLVVPLIPLSRVNLGVNLDFKEKDYVFLKPLRSESGEGNGGKGKNGKHRPRLTLITTRGSPPPLYELPLELLGIEVHRYSPLTQVTRSVYRTHVGADSGKDPSPGKDPSDEDSGEDEKWSVKETVRWGRLRRLDRFVGVNLGFIYLVAISLLSAWPILTSSTVAMLIFSLYVAFAATLLGLATVRVPGAGTYTSPAVALILVPFFFALEISNTFMQRYYADGTLGIVTLAAFSLALALIYLTDFVSVAAGRFPLERVSCYARFGEVSFAAPVFAVGAVLLAEILAGSYHGVLHALGIVPPAQHLYYMTLGDLAHLHQPYAWYLSKAEFAFPGARDFSRIVSRATGADEKGMLNGFYAVTFAFAAMLSAYIFTLTLIWRPVSSRRKQWAEACDEFAKSIRRYEERIIRSYSLHKRSPIEVINIACNLLDVKNESVWNMRMELLFGSGREVPGYKLGYVPKDNLLREYIEVLRERYKEGEVDWREWRGYLESKRSEIMRRLLTDGL